MKFKVEYRPPRPGEVMMFLCTHAKAVSAKDSNLDVRFSPCPVCHRDASVKGRTSNTVNTKTGLWFCWSCQAKGNWFTLTRAFGDPLRGDDRFIEPPQRMREVNLAGWVKMSEAATRHPRRPVVDGHYPELLEYCHGRGFTDETLAAWRVSTKGPKTLRWPLYVLEEETPGEWAWRVVNGRLRACIDREAAHTGDWFEVAGGDTGLLIGNHLLDEAAPEATAIITEGQWDAMTAWQLGFKNVFSLPNGAANVHVARLLRYIPDGWDVWLALDMDGPGDLAAEAFFEQLGPDKLARIHMPEKDLNAWLMANPALTKNDVLACVKGISSRASRAAADSKAAEANVGIRRIKRETPEERDARRAAAKEKANLVIDSPWPSVTHLLAGGLRAAQTTGFLARSGIGKTTMVTQWAVYAASRDVTAGLILLEGDQETNEQKILDCTWGTATTDLEHDAIARNLLWSELHGSNPGWQRVVEEIAILADRGAKLVVVDNLDFCMPRANLSAANSQKVQAYGRIVELAVKLRIHVLVVWQPLKLEADKRVDSGSQKGASQMLQDSDNYLNLNRVDGQDLNCVEVEKCRELGQLTERYVYMRYDPARRVSVEVDVPKVDKRGGDAVVVIKPTLPVAPGDG